MNRRRKAINHCMTTPYIWSTKGFNTDPLDQQTGVLPTKLSQSTTVIQGFKQTGVLSTKLSQSTTVIKGIKQTGVLPTKLSQSTTVIQGIKHLVKRV